MNATAAALPQKRATIIVGEPVADLIDWQRRFFPQSAAVADQRVGFVADAGPAAFAGRAGEFHAILLHADTSPPDGSRGCLAENRRWLAVAFDALQEGGLLGIAATRRIFGIERTLARTGFSVVEHAVAPEPNARKPRTQPIWLARKGKSLD